MSPCCGLSPTASRCPSSPRRARWSSLPEWTRGLGRSVHVECARLPCRPGGKWRQGTTVIDRRAIEVIVDVDALGPTRTSCFPAVPSVRLEEGSRMGHIHHEYHIDAPPEVAWAVGRGANRIPEWNTTTVSVKDVSGPLDRRGRNVYRGLEDRRPALEVRWQVEQVDPGRMADVTASSPQRRERPPCRPLRT